MFKKIIVFGGSGFIGTYVVEELLKKNYEVIIADLNPPKYIDNKYFKKCDILNVEEINSILTEDIDVVYNFAGFANLDDAIANPIRAIELNVLGNMNILEASKNKVKRFVYASSAYAMSDKGSFYGISKLTSEKLIEEYYKKFGLQFTIIRYGSVYGERDYENNYIYNLIKTSLKNKEINHSGDGDEIREYIHAADVAKLSCQIIESDEFINEHIILTGVERMKRKELFYMIKEILGGDLKINLNNDGYCNHYKITPYSFSPQRSKKLVANPYIDMGQGLLDCLEDIEKNSNKS